MGIDFQAMTTNLGDGVARVAVAGEADLFTAPELKEALANAVDGGAHDVIVDLSDATFIDSTTLGVLIGTVRRLRPLGGTVAIACHDANIVRIFEITRLDQVFPIFETADEGLAFLRDPERTRGSAG
jgi:anti-sigma B factor antagonist